MYIPLCILSEKNIFSGYDFRIMYILSGNVFLILYSSPVCNTLSKACLMSKNAAVQYLLLSSALFISLVIRWTCIVVVFLSESELMVGVILFRSSIGSSFVMKRFSNNFERTGSKLERMKCKMTTNFGVNVPYLV